MGPRTGFILESIIRYEFESFSYSKMNQRFPAYIHRTWLQKKTEFTKISETCILRVKLKGLIDTQLCHNLLGSSQNGSKLVGIHVPLDDLTHSYKQNFNQNK